MFRFIRNLFSMFGEGLKAAGHLAQQGAHYMEAAAKAAEIGSLELLIEQRQRMIGKRAGSDLLADIEGLQFVQATAQKIRHLRDDRSPDMDCLISESRSKIEALDAKRYKTHKAQYGDGAKKSEFTTKDLKLHGWAKQWYPCGQLMWEANFYQGRLVGGVSAFSESGNPYWKFEFDYKSRVGKMLVWFCDSSSPLGFSWNKNRRIKGRASIIFKALTSAKLRRALLDSDPSVSDWCSQLEEFTSIIDTYGDRS